MQIGKAQTRQLTKNQRFAQAKRMNARLAFYAWLLSGGVLLAAYGPSVFLTFQAVAFFTVGSFVSIYVIAYTNFMFQRGVAITLQNLIGKPSSRAARFINGVGIGLMAGNIVMAYIAAELAVRVMFGLPPEG